MFSFQIAFSSLFTPLSVSLLYLLKYRVVYNLYTKVKRRELNKIELILLSIAANNIYENIYILYINENHRIRSLVYVFNVILNQIFSLNYKNTSNNFRRYC